MPVSGSTAAPDQLAPPPALGRCMVPLRLCGVNSGPSRKPSTASIASWRISGVKSARSSMVAPWYSNAAGRVGKGWVGHTSSPGMSVSVGTGRSSMGHTGSPVTRSNTYRNPCLLTWASALMGRPSTSMSTRFGAAGKS